MYGTRELTVEYLDRSATEVIFGKSMQVRRIPMVTVSVDGLSYVEMCRTWRTDEIEGERHYRLVSQRRILRRGLHLGNLVPRPEGGTPERDFRHFRDVGAFCAEYPDLADILYRRGRLDGISEVFTLGVLAKTMWLMAELDKEKFAATTRPARGSVVLPLHRAEKAGLADRIIPAT